ncbi:MAG: RNA 2',3'-cyclic phosphodiesterase [Candidatus Omnitrophica bacterium]|nr:RNA 2',3'-cyclic phosphodiesterase [Candidatus Omnitrophota bacterium]
MRTFIALELSDEIKEEFSRLEEKLKTAEADVKWVKPHNIHLTLKFLGDVEESKIGQIKNVLDGISAQNNSFEISLFKLGAFPNLNQLRVLWVGLEKGFSEAEKIANSIEDNLEKIGFPKEKRPFSAHFTLGRVKSGKNKNQLKELISSLEVRPKSCVIKHITLFQSTLTPKGPIYASLHRAKLTDR